MQCQEIVSQRLSTENLTNSSNMKKISSSKAILIIQEFKRTMEYLKKERHSLLELYLQSFTEKDMQFLANLINCYNPEFSFFVEEPLEKTKMLSTEIILQFVLHQHERIKRLNKFIKYDVTQPKLVLRELKSLNLREI